MDIPRAINRLIGLALCVGAASVIAVPSLADDGYPNRAVRIIVPFPAGGGTDVLARLIAEGLARDLGKSFYVENVSGAGGTIGISQMVRAAPDGYTLAATSPGPVTIYPALSSGLPYDADKDIVHATIHSEGPGVAVVARNSRFKSLKDVIAEAKAKPGIITVASAGVGSWSHMSIELLKALAGVDVKHVPYRGTAPAINDIVGGHIDMTIESISAVTSLIGAGDLRPLAMTSASRYPLRPEIPTFDEEGVKGYNHTTWAGLAAPAGTPKPVLERIHGAIIKMVKDTAFLERLRKLGAVPIASTPDEARAFLEKEREKLRQLGKANNIVLN